MCFLYLHPALSHLNFISSSVALQGNSTRYTRNLKQINRTTSPLLSSDMAAHRPDNTDFSYYTCSLPHSPPCQSPMQVSSQKGQLQFFISGHLLPFLLTSLLACFFLSQLKLISVCPLCFSYVLTFKLGDMRADAT